MKEFDAITFDKATYERELSNYEQLLKTQTVIIFYQKTKKIDCFGDKGIQL